MTQQYDNIKTFLKLIGIDIDKELVDKVVITFETGTVPQVEIRKAVDINSNASKEVQLFKLQPIVPSIKKGKKDEVPIETYHLTGRVGLIKQLSVFCTNNGIENVTTTLLPYDPLNIDTHEILIERITPTTKKEIEGYVTRMKEIYAI